MDGGMSKNAIACGKIGALTGAAVGTVVGGPGVGTIAGKVVGGAAGLATFVGYKKLKKLF